MRVLVQCSRTAWHGGPDLCVKPLGGVPAWLATVQAVREAGHEPIIGCPLTDVEHFGGLSDAPISAGDTPYARIMGLGLAGLDVVARTDGIDAFAPWELLERFANHARLTQGAVRFPDDWPAALGFEVYSAAWLESVRERVQADPNLAIHFRFASHAHRWQSHRMDDRLLHQARAAMRTVYDAQRQPVEPVPGRAGDQLSLRYEIAAERILADRVRRQAVTPCVILDAGGGEGHGARYLAPRLGARVLNVDWQPVGGDGVEEVQGDLTEIPLRVADADYATCMDVIEHVKNPGHVLREIRRVLKPGGLLVLATPQNSHGHIPVNAVHVLEYTWEGIRDLIEHAGYAVEEIIGIKAGRVIVRGDPTGTNTVLVARR